MRVVFGMPGTQNLYIYEAFHNFGAGIAHFLIRNEQAATLMANGFARATGEVAVALTVPGPGATNASTGIGDAYTDCVPVLLITGGFDRRTNGRDRSKLFHGLDQKQFFEPITRYYGCPQTCEEIPEAVERAFRAMLSGRPGPAVIEVSPDLAAAECDELPIPDRFRPDEQRQASAAAITRAAECISSLTCPLILVGGDVIASEATDSLRQLAEFLNAPVIETRLGKGVLSAEHPLWLGHCREPHVREMLKQADGLLAVGVRFTQIDTSGWQATYPSTVVQFDRDEREIGREVPAEMGVVGDLKPTLDALKQELEHQGYQQLHSEWQQRLAQQKDQANSRSPVPILHQIREALPRDGIVSVDVTSTGYRAFGEFPVYDRRRFLYPCHFVTLGFAFPAALGAKIACPDRPVVALCGDGGFLMSSYELATAVEHQIGVVTIVVADRCLTAIKGSQAKSFSGRTIDTQMHVPDFVAFARSFGAHAERAKAVDELVPMIQAGIARSGPTVIEVPMDDRIEELIGIIPWLDSD